MISTINNSNEYDIYKERDISTNDDLYFLSKYSDFDDNSEIIPLIRFEEMDSPILMDFRRRFNIQIITDSEDEIKFICKLKKKAIEMLAYVGKELNDQRYDKYNPIEIIDRAQKDNYTLNCRYKTYIFTLMALSAGLKARMVSCMSMDLRYTGCHWVTEIYSNVLKKWIVVDIPMDYFYFDEKGIPLSLLEMRQRIIANKKIKIFSTNKAHIAYTQEYWKIYSFRYRFLAINSSDFFRGNVREYYYLNPKGFVINDKKIEINNEITYCNYYYNAEGIW